MPAIIFSARGRADSHHDQKAWDFDGHQKGDQVNLKYVNDHGGNRFTAYFDWNDKVEPNEDATAFGNAQTPAAASYTPYTRPFIYPDVAACTAYVNTNPATPGTPPAQFGNNFTNCFSAVQREDLLGYIQYDWKILIVVGACILMWGHYWDASNGMTIASMVAPTRFRATAAGFGYVFVKAAAFFGAFVFPLVNEALGKAGATFAVSILSLIGFLAAKFILPEVYGYVDTEKNPG